MTENIVGVMLGLPFDEPFDYRVEGAIELGQIAAVEFGQRRELGVVWKLGRSSDLPDAKIKPILGSTEWRLDARLMKFVEFVASYNAVPKGLVLKMVLSVPKAFDAMGEPAKRKRKIFAVEAPDPSHSLVELTAEQQTAAADLVGKVGADKGFSATLLDGITGSGKTEVYFEAVAEALRGGRQVLVLVPEIALTSQWLGRFAKRFGAEPTVWHSALTPAQRVANYKAILSGAARVVIGARSALFLPYPELGLMVVDESHDHSFKQEDGANYQGRDMAVARAKFEDIPIILSTATPDLETVVNVEEGKYSVVRLRSRFASAELPEIRVVDLRAEKPGKGSFISPPLAEALRRNLEAGEQSILFLNRRGYAPLTICRDCGHRISCPHCTAWLTEHRNVNRLVCHHCGYSAPLPKKCPECGSEDGLAACGPGVERLLEEVKARFPEARAAIVSSDITSSLKEISDVIAQMERREIDILIGTQIIAKGHHFPELTLVGIVDADIGLMGSDLRASERAFQLLTQVSGRAGRGEKKGAVYIQTLYPENNVLKAMLSNDREAFLSIEREARRALRMPPFGRLAAVIVSSRDREAAKGLAERLGRLAPHNAHVSVLGPAEAPIFMLRGKYRYRLLVKADKGVRLPALLAEWLAKAGAAASGNVKVEADIDPYSFM